MTRAGRPSRRDVRLRALWLTLALTGGIGLLIHGLPRPVPRGEGFDVTRHMQAQRVATRFREGVRLLHTGHPAQAAEAFRAVIALAPSMPEARVNLGFSLLGLERPEEAEAAFRIALRLRPVQANAHYGLALALAAQQRHGEARQAMHAYLRLSGPSDPYLAKAHRLLESWPAPEECATPDDNADNPPET